MFTVTTPACIKCGKQTEFSIPTSLWEGYQSWQSGSALIQEALPTLSVDERELLKTGIHVECWELVTNTDKP